MYPSFDVKRFVSALQSDEKLPIIWHGSSGLHSGPIVHFINNREAQLSALGIEEEALQRSPPSPICPSLFLVGIGAADYGCPAAVISEVLGSGGVFTGYGRVRKSPYHLMDLGGCKQLASHCRMFQQCFSGAEEGLKWARPAATRGFSVGIV